MSSSFTHTAAGTDRRTVAASALLGGGLLLTGGTGVARARGRTRARARDRAQGPARPAAGLTLRLPAPTGPHPSG
ncbi:hypothetical protein PQR15_27280 [Streptomyces lydicus]|nr:hypothetical protein [Streptomyces lydicus]